MDSTINFLKSDIKKAQIRLELVQRKEEEIEEKKTELKAREEEVIHWRGRFDSLKKEYDNRKAQRQREYDELVEFKKMTLAKAEKAKNYNCSQKNASVSSYAADVSSSSVAPGYSISHLVPLVQTDPKEFLRLVVADVDIDGPGNNEDSDDDDPPFRPN